VKTILLLAATWLQSQPPAPVVAWNYVSVDAPVPAAAFKVRVDQGAWVSLVPSQIAYVDGWPFVGDIPWGTFSYPLAPLSAGSHVVDVAACDASDRCSVTSAAFTIAANGQALAAPGVFIRQ
jgi:hypothetical protein